MVMATGMATGTAEAADTADSLAAGAQLPAADCATRRLAAAGPESPA
jgi:hypothetical protein